TSRATQLAVVAAREAVADAGLPESLSDFDGIAATSAGASDETSGSAAGATKAGDIAGIVVNAAVSGFPEVEEATRTLDSEGARFVSPMFVPASLTNMPACQIAMDLGVHGPVNASALACASGAYALLEARDLILSGQADVMIAGGTDASITAPMFAGLGAMRALSPRRGRPGRSQPPVRRGQDRVRLRRGRGDLRARTALPCSRPCRRALRLGARRSADERRIPRRGPRAVGPLRCSGDHPRSELLLPDRRIRRSG